MQNIVDRIYDYIVDTLGLGEMLTPVGEEVPQRPNAETIPEYIATPQIEPVKALPTVGNPNVNDGREPGAEIDYEPGVTDEESEEDDSADFVLIGIVVGLIVIAFVIVCCW